jgi:hypothetical protein
VCVCVCVCERERERERERESRMLCIYIIYVCIHVCIRMYVCVRVCVYIIALTKAKRERLFRHATEDICQHIYRPNTLVP